MKDQIVNTEKKDSFAALRYREFRSYLGMRFFFTFAYQMQAIVLGMFIYDLTKDPLHLAFIGLFEAIPAISIALYGGYVADKNEKKALLLKIFACVLCCSLVMLTFTSKEVDLSTSNLLLVLYAMIFIIGLARGFFGPTTFSIMGQILPKSLYPNGATWSSSSWQLASILGPATGGLIYGNFGITAAYSVIVVFITMALLCILFLKKHEPTYVPKESILKSLTEGVQFVFKSKMMLASISLDLFSVFFGGAVALLPVIASEVLHVGSEGAGYLRAAASLGSVLTMLVMTKYPPMNKPWRNLLIAVTGFGISIICYGLSTSFYLTLFFLFCEGAFDSVSVVIRSTIMQLLTPDQMRGRVSAVNSMFIGSSNELGAFESGLTAKLMRTVPAVVFGGTMTLGIAFITYLKTKNLLSLTLNDIKPAERLEEQV